MFGNGLEYTVLDESRAFFEALEIGEELLAGVETLVVDGGAPVYDECSPVWDGEDALFGIHSLDDLALLPSLTRVSGTEMITVPGKRGILAARGVTVVGG
ncbi:hypothetical protein OHT61_15645 [Streptomyces sp. NBC_00178]|uniref:DUF6892 domain-containing protein n=1 Tax=Streptomyces sp. NBC_00178 TaxID=2975672 RepID=UPI002E27DAE3|nr:hypothetical protein [Streptomyces sp. NBC_00178]